MGEAEDSTYVCVCHIITNRVLLEVIDFLLSLHIFLKGLNINKKTCVKKLLIFLVLKNLGIFTENDANHVYISEKGPNCCSNAMISFHYVTPEEMYLAEFLIYKVKVE